MTQIEYRLYAFDLASPRGFADGNRRDSRTTPTTMIKIK